MISAYVVNYEETTARGTSEKSMVIKAHTPAQAKLRCSEQVAKRNDTLEVKTKSVMKVR